MNIGVCGSYVEDQFHIQMWHSTLYVLEMQIAPHCDNGFTAAAPQLVQSIIYYIP